MSCATSRSRYSGCGRQRGGSRRSRKKWWVARLARRGNAPPVQRCRLPSTFSRRQPSRATSGRASRWATRAARAPGSTRVSGFSSSSRRPRASARPWLLAQPKPRLPVLATRVTPGNSARSISTLPSTEALSTTISCSCAGGRPPCCSTDCRQSRSSSRTFQLTMTMLSSGAGRASGVDTVGGMFIRPAQRGGRWMRRPARAAAKRSATSR